MENKVNNVLQSIIVDEDLLIEALNGKMTIAGARDTFKSYLDHDFKNWHLDNEGTASEEIEVEMYEMIQDANLAQIFNSFSKDLNRLCFTQSQIIRFCQKYSRHLRQSGYATFFLFKENNKFFVARIRVYPAGLAIYADRLRRRNLWNADNRRRVIIPKLAA